MVLMVFHKIESKHLKPSNWKHIQSKRLLYTYTHELFISLYLPLCPFFFVAKWNAKRDRLHKGLLALKEVAKNLNVLSTQRSKSIPWIKLLTFPSIHLCHRNQVRKNCIHSSSWNTISTTADLMEQCTLNERCIQMECGDGGKPQWIF